MDHCSAWTNWLPSFIPISLTPFKGSWMRCAAKWHREGMRCSPQSFLHLEQKTVCLVQRLSGCHIRALQWSFMTDRYGWDWSDLPQALPLPPFYRNLCLSAGISRWISVTYSPDAHSVWGALLDALKDWPWLLTIADERSLSKSLQSHSRMKYEHPDVHTQGQARECRRLPEKCNFKLSWGGSNLSRKISRSSRQLDKIVVNRSWCLDQ
jgi:hypothetical protein